MPPKPKVHPLARAADRRHRWKEEGRKSKISNVGHGIENLEAKDIESENAGLLRSVTKVRACLLLARIHEQAGRREECIEVARLGLKLAGMAVGPKKALKDILSRCGVPA